MEDEIYEKYLMLINAAKNPILQEYLNAEKPNINFEYNKYSNTLLYEELDKNSMFSNLSLVFGNHKNLLNFIDYYQVTNIEREKNEVRIFLEKEAPKNIEDIFSVKAYKGEYTFCEEKQTLNNLNYVIDSISSFLELSMPLENKIKEKHIKQKYYGEEM